MIAASFYNAQGATKQDKTPFEIWDFFPHLAPAMDAKPVMLTEEQTRHMIENLNAQFGGRDLRSPEKLALLDGASA